jgi:hypothetical protein
MLCPSGIFCDHLIHFSRVGVLYQTKNLAALVVVDMLPKLFCVSNNENKMKTMPHAKLKHTC